MKWRNGVILGPYFFDQNVNGLAYLRMLNEFVFPQLAISTTCIGRDCFEASGGHRTALQHIASLQSEIALTKCSERIV